MPDKTNTLTCFSCSKQASQVTPWDDWGTLWHCTKCEKWWVYIKVEDDASYAYYIERIGGRIFPGYHYVNTEIFPGYHYVNTESFRESPNISYIRIYLEPIPFQTLTYFDCVRNDLDIK